MLNQRLLYAVLTSTLFLIFHINALAQSENRFKTIKEIDSLRKQLSKKEKIFLSPLPEEFAAHAEFLKQPKTGLFRLLPRGVYGNQLTIRGGGAYYSFVRLTHEYGYGSDIQLQVREPFATANFVSGFAGANYGFFTVIGDIPLEKVTLEHRAIKFLIAYDPPSKEPEVRAEQRRAYTGIEKDGFMYKNSVLAIPNCTYVLRSIDFHNSDVLVAFRVLKKEDDGSLLILWKMLKRFSRPELIQTVSW
jgi:hypothetical protein